MTSKLVGFETLIKAWPSFRWKMFNTQAYSGIPVRQHCRFIGSNVILLMSEFDARV